MKNRLLTTMTCLVLLSGCALERYQPAAPHFSGNAAVQKETSMVVYLAPIFPDKPFSEMVCDNETGVMWSPAEAQHIGFTQQYGKTLAKNGPQMALLARLPPAQQAGMQASGQYGAMNIDSRILVPYGRFISDNLKEALGANGQICESEACVRQAMQLHPAARLVTVTFTKFRVAEAQRNMLLLEVEGSASAARGNDAPNVVRLHSEVNEDITSEGHFHSDFLIAMNKIANHGTSAIVEQIIAAGR